MSFQLATRPQSFVASKGLSFTVPGAGFQAGAIYGPVTAALLNRQNLDFGLVSAAVTQGDQWGLASDGFVVAKVNFGAGIP